MTEVAMFSVAAKLLCTIASPVFKKAYEKACSIQSARDDLEKLKRSIETIQAVLLDAEKKCDSSAAVKNWIKRVRDVLYDAEDLFDEVATDDLLRKQIKGNNKLLKKVRAFASSSLNPIVSNKSIAKRVKDIRKSLLLISEDMKQFQFVECLNERTVFGIRKGQETGAFVDAKNVIGRDEDMKAVLKMLLDVSNDAQQVVPVIAIVGIGGMGKTTLAQLVYNHEDVKSFENRWFACISDASSDREVFGKIFQSICERSYGDLSVTFLQDRIKDSVEGEKFLLVLDDVWDDDRGRWQDRLSLLSRGSKESRIIVTTRSLSVARAVGAIETHNLDGLSKADSWNLFKRVADFTPERERDSRWTDLGKEILKKCANVPLAIKSIASLLFEKNTIEEWESFRNEELPMLGEGHRVAIMPVLKLSYEHLTSNLKHCFAYCALFPKDRVFEKEALIYLWISQGYVTPNNEKQTVEDVGHSYFMELLRRSFFQVEVNTRVGDIRWCKIHDLIHDLAQYVAREESITLTTSSSKIIDGKRHVTAGCGTNGELIIPTSLHNVNLLRSFICWHEFGIGKTLVLEKQFENYKLLRALSLPDLEIENIPTYIGELKYLRYLDISSNKFKILPDSITKLVNLCTLNIRRCDKLEALPDDFRKLINIRHLVNDSCRNLKHMPPGFEELTSLQRLDEFKVGRGICGGQRSRLDVLSGLELKGQVTIDFEDETDDWDGVECWQPPLTLKGLEIYNYKGMRIPKWSHGPSMLPKLTRLSLYRCSRVKCLPPLRHIPNLNHLRLEYMWELQCIQEEEEDEGKQSPKVTAGSNALPLPDLKILKLRFLPKLKGWWGKVEATTTVDDVEADQDLEQEQHSSQLLSFPSLSLLLINCCPEFNPKLLCPRLSSLKIVGTGNVKMIQQLLSTHDNSSPSTSSTTTSTTSSSSLESVSILGCDELSSFPGKSLTSLQRLYISGCNKLKEVHLPPSHLNILEKLTLSYCGELELWEEKKRGVDWDSLPNLRKLVLAEIPSREMLPDCLRLHQDLGKLTITY